MEKMKLSFQQENDILLNYILETSLIKKIKENNALNFKENQELTNVNDYYIELNITPVCNQKCNYCYLVKYGNELYPPEIRGEENILNNLKIFLDYLLTNNIHPFRFDLFSGEIWEMEFGNKIFDILLEYKLKGLNYGFIMIPSNMSFLTHDSTTKIIQNYINRFRKRDVDLRFSASFDGKYIDTDTRSFRDENKNILKSNDEFYDKLFSFCKKNNYGFHPMVGAYKIENWKENYKWFHEMLKKYDLDYKSFIMFLEVRNDYWTQEKINSYLDFLNFSFEYEISNYFDGDPEKFFDNYIMKLSIYKNYEPKFPNFMSKSVPACTIYRSLIVRLGDLGIGPCHRTHYDKFIYGNYIVENNKIVGLKARNVQLANRILLGTMNSIPKCSGCLIRDICPKGCFGAQYEASGEILEPINSVCELEKQKSFFIINKYEELGLMEKIKDNFKGLYDQFIKIKDEREYKEWKKLMLQK